MTTPPRVEVLPIEKGATPDLGNVNKHTQRGSGLLENELRKRGAFRSIASAGKDTDVPVVYAGNLTLEKAVEAGFTEIVNVHVRGDQLVNVVRDDLAPGSAEAIALGISDNEIGKQSYSPDIDILAALAAGDNAILSALKAEDKVFAGMLEGMGLKAEAKDAPVDVDRAAELLEKWQVKTGDLWQIGEHRLICGDCTDAATVARVMGYDKIDAVFTSPPYNSGDVAMRGGGRFSFAKKGADTLYTEFSDDMTPDEYYRLCMGALVNISTRTSDTHAVFWNVSYNANSRDDYGKIVFSSENPFRVQETIIWDKCHALPITSVGIFSRISEMIFLMSKDEKYLTNQKIGEQSVYWNTWRISSDDSQDTEIHKASFPVKLPIRAIEDFTTPGMVVFDPFCGYGTVLLACENTGRHGRGVELSPVYVAAALERMSVAFPALAIRKLE